MTPQLLRKAGVSVESLLAAANGQLQKMPRVTGSREANRFYISAETDRTFLSAQEQADANALFANSLFTTVRRWLETK